MQRIATLAHVTCNDEAAVPASVLDSDSDDLTDTAPRRIGPLVINADTKLDGVTNDDPMTMNDTVA